MSKNCIYWIGVIPEDQRVSKRFKYGDYSWMDYSRKTWEHFCGRYGCEFVHYDKPSRPDLMKYKINWQRWIDIYDYLPSDYNKVMLVDASIMVKWDAPNYFDTISHEQWGAVRADENWGWTYRSAKGYEDMFPDVTFNHNNYFSSGFVCFTKQHEKMINDLAEFYFKNHAEILKREDETVLRGRDQPLINYFVQKYKVPVNFWPITWGVNHLWRREILGYNWQLKDDATPFFVKYFYAWIFSGFSDRGKTRQELMSQTWDMVKHNYNG